MSKKKGDPARPPEESNQRKTTKPEREVNPSVRFFKQGVLLNKPVIGKGKGGAIAKRGEIVQWSSASRRRMREMMLTHQAPQGWGVSGATFTIPGPLLTSAEARTLWKTFCRELERQGWGMIWRIEIQARGAFHWHAIVIQPEYHPADIMILWGDALRTLGETAHTTAKGFSCYGMRTALPGAAECACVVTGAGDRGAWMRYLQDHASKSKQAQIAEGIGRHWGVVGRRRFEILKGLDAQLSDLSYARVVRWMRRLATPIRPNPSAPFGRSLSYSPRRGMYGKSVWYSNPLTIARFCDYARAVERQDRIAGLSAWEEYSRSSLPS